MGLNEDASAFATALYQERQRQIAKFGPQHHIPDLPQGGPEVALDDGEPSLLIGSEEDCKKACDQAFVEGQGSWAHIAVEELAEAVYAETDDDRIVELTQLATVCMGWVETIRARAEAKIGRGQVPREMVRRESDPYTSSGPGEVT